MKFKIKKFHSFTNGHRIKNLHPGIDLDHEDIKTCKGWQAEEEDGNRIIGYIIFRQNEDNGTRLEIPSFWVQANSHCCKKLVKKVMVNLNKATGFEVVITMNGGSPWCQKLIHHIEKHYKLKFDYISTDSTNGYFIACRNLNGMKSPRFFI